MFFQELALLLGALFWRYGRSIARGAAAALGGRAGTDARRIGTLRSMRRQAREHTVQRLQVYRLHQVHVEASLGRAPSIVGLPVAGERDEARLSQVAVGTHGARDVVAAHARQPEVAQHHVDALAA